MKEANMKKSLPAAAATVLAMSLPAAADPTIGIGLSFAFQGGSNTEAGVGLRLFSDNRADSFAGSLGVDYLFKSKRLRPTVGLAYLGSDAYLSVDMGFGGEGLDFGLGAGLLDTEDFGVGGGEGSGNDSMSGGT
jgi:hypothetical protein